MGNGGSEVPLTRQSLHSGEAAELAGLFGSGLLPSHLFFPLCPPPRGVEKEVLPGIGLRIVSELVLGFRELSGDLGFLPTSAHPSSGPLSSVKWEGCSAYLQGPSSGDVTCFVALHPLALLRDGWETLKRCHSHPGVPCAVFHARATRCQRGF